MGKKKKKKFGSSSSAIMMSILSVILMLGCIFKPYWLYFPSNGYVGWPERNVGLFKISGKYTDLIRTAADTSLYSLTSRTCKAWIVKSGSLTSSTKAIAGSLVNAIAGLECPQQCIDQLRVRCKGYKVFRYSSITICGLLVIGSFLVLVGALMPALGEERVGKGDIGNNLAIMLTGVTLTTISLIAFGLLSVYLYKSLNNFGFYVSPSFGFSFYGACFAEIILLASSIPQLHKYFIEKKEIRAKENRKGIRLEGNLEEFPMML